MTTTNRPIVLPSSPFTGQSVKVVLEPEDLTIRLTWMGTENDANTDYWRVVGDFSWGNKFDDIYVSKSGDKMSPEDAFLVNLDVSLVDYRVNRNPPYDPIAANSDFVSLVTRFQESGYEVFGAFGIEDNKELPLVSGPLVIRNEAIIAGGVKVDEKIEVIRPPYLEGGEVGYPATFTYRWQRCNDSDYGGIDPAGRIYDVVAKAEIYSQSGIFTVGEELETTSTLVTDPGTGCKIQIDEIDENKRVLSFSITEEGSGYRLGEILKVDGTDLEIIVTDTIVLRDDEVEPPSGAGCWLVNPDIDSTHTDYHILTEDDIGGYIRCEITCSVGSETAVSYSNPIGIIS